MAEMTGKVCIVTGATSGVGLETARGLARMGATVVLAVRNAERGEAAARDVLASLASSAARGVRESEEPGNSGVGDSGIPGSPRAAEGAAQPADATRLHVMLLDVADLDSVRAFAASFGGRFDRLDVLVNNAGIHTAERALTPQGIERTFATNHLGHFLLTHLLLDLLKASAPSRVVNVASEAHALGRMDFDDLMGEKRWSGNKAYSQSKLANVMFTYALARRLEGTGVTANAAHPGSVRTGWARGKESGAFRFVVALASPFLLSPEKGARTPLRVATDPALAGVSGRYFVREKEAPSTRASMDVAAQERLWRESERLAGL